MSYDVFISYRRSGGEHAAKMIRDSLVEAGYKVFFDVESLRSGNFNTKIYSVIDECTDFVLVLSPNALDRCSNENDWVRREVEYALSKNKNIIPILLKGFSFDCELPDSLKTLPQINGIEASSSFYDAFIEKLQEFMKSRRSLFKTITQSKAIKKMLLIFVSVVLVLCAVLGLKLISERSSDYPSEFYPQTKSEQTLVDDVTQYVKANLLHMETMAFYADTAISMVEDEIYHPSEKNLDTVNPYIAEIDAVDTADCAPSDIFLDKVYSSPFKISDLTELHNYTTNFKEEWLQYINFIEYIAGDSCVFSQQTKADILDCYRKHLQETLSMYACSVNMIFTCVTHENAFDELQSEIQSELNYILLETQYAAHDHAFFEKSRKEHSENLRKLSEELAAITGNTHKLFYTNSDNNVAELSVELRELCMPEEGDSFEILWTKMMFALESGFYDTARDCAASCREVDEEPNSDIYMDSIDAYINLMEEKGLMYGCVVTDYYKPDGINELLEIGDIIISVDGKEVKSHEEYNEIKAQITTENYELVVLRLNDSGELKFVSLDYSKSMPRVYMYNIVNYTEE